MPVSAWRFCYFPAELPTATVLPPFATPTAGEWTRWRDNAAIPAKTPFLLSPRFDYDTALNSFFLSADMLGAAYNTQIGYARDLKAFLNFLWHNRNCVSWRDATTADHLAYLVWRRRDPAGPASITPLGPGGHRGQPVLRMAGEREKPHWQPDPATTTEGSALRGRAPRHCWNDSGDLQPRRRQGEDRMGASDHLQAVA